MKLFKKHGNKNPDPVNDPVHAHSGLVLVQMMDPEKGAGPTMVQMAQAQAQAEEMALVLQHPPVQ